MSVKRTMSLYENSPVLVIREEMTNINKLGRIYNIVQHPSIAPPFLDESVIVDSNASKGFWAGNPMPCPEEPVVYWPSIIYKEKLVDLRCLVDNHDPGVVSFITAGEECGWITACNPGKGLLIGLELDDAARAERFSHEAQDRGVLLGWSMYAEATIRLAPPLIITAEEVDRGLSIIEETLAAIS